MLLAVCFFDWGEFKVPTGFSGKKVGSALRMLYLGDVQV